MGMSLYEELKDSALRIEWWDEGYEHYRSVVFADNFSELTSPLSPASIIGDWRPVLTSDEEK